MESFSDENYFGPGDCYLDSETRLGIFLSHLTTQQKLQIHEYADEVRLGYLMLVNEGYEIRDMLDSIYDTSQVYARTFAALIKIKDRIFDLEEAYGLDFFFIGDINTGFNLPDPRFKIRRFVEVNYMGIVYSDIWGMN